MACWNFIPPDHPWRRARQLSWEERWTFLRALVLLPLVALALRCLGLRRCQRLLRRRVPAGGEVDPEVLGNKARATARLVAAAGRRGLWRGNCLCRSLVLWSLLSRRGVPAELRVGVRLESGRLAAHAWVTFAGAALNDSDEELGRFAAFDRPIVPRPEAP